MKWVCWESSCTQKESIADLIRTALQDACVAIENPETSLPARLHVVRGASLNSPGYFRLFDGRVADDGRRHDSGLKWLASLTDKIDLIEVGRSPSSHDNRERLR
jgi:hypothetical protein